MVTTVSEPRSSRAARLARGPWLLAVIGLIAFALAWFIQGDDLGLWLPGLGLGIVLIAWLGWRILPVLAIVLLVIRCVTHASQPVALLLGDVALHVALIGVSWWFYHHVARGSRWLDDPRSATLFLILVPGGLSAMATLLQTLIRLPDEGPWLLAAAYWLSRMTGILVIVPFLIVAITPILLRRGLLVVELPPALRAQSEGAPARFGDTVELGGLTFATTFLAMIAAWFSVHEPASFWLLWATCLVLIVWTCIRQGLRGASFCATVTSLGVLVMAQFFQFPRETQSVVQGSLLAFCSSALLVGVSASWIRANETRYRQVVSRIPFVVYSVRLPYGVPSSDGAAPTKPRSDSKFDFHSGPSISKLAEVVLVSPACESVFRRSSEAMIGPFSRWLDIIVSEDHELVIAALTQLCLQRQPVSVEYRLRGEVETDAGNNHPAEGVAPGIRWLRDTLTPHYSEEGLMDGWEGLIEDITDQRALSQNLRKMTNMLQVLVANLPTGVYFVQAPHGNPILVNARARQLLGQREDLSAGLAHLSRVYRLHRTDGTEYPWEELPVAKAIRLGIASRANDIVLHRRDGRKIPLMTWAAPLDLQNTGKPDAAVWVLEDWTAMQQAQTALRESELRLRAIIETMAEGVIVQDDRGAVIDCNIAACTILGMTRSELISTSGLFAHVECLREGGASLARDEMPDRIALRTGQPVRDMVVGLSTRPGGGVVWVMVNSLPLPVGPSVGLNHQKARVVTTFGDVTEQVRVKDSLRLNRDKYQKLVENLPFMLVQRNRDGMVTYFNPAALELTGYSSEQFLTPGFCDSVIHPEDQPAYHAGLDFAAGGQSTRVEVRLKVKDGSFKNVLAFLQPNVHQEKVIGSTTLVVDITMQRRLEAELQQAKHLELVGRLASGTVHDFNNLLQVIMGTAGLAKLDLPPDHIVTQHLNRIEEVGEQASHLAGQILTFSKQRPRQFKSVDLNALVLQTVKLAKGIMPKNILIETRLDPSQPKALGDEHALKQVAMNLCLNARDAMPDGGELTIQTDFAVHDRPDLQIAGAAWVHLSIKDTGIGMSEEVRRRVFEAFFSTKERGTGLGLAVVQRILKDHGGVIDVWSEPGIGTRFDVWLPQSA